MSLKKFLAKHGKHVDLPSEAHGTQHEMAEEDILHPHHGTEHEFRDELDSDMGHDAEGAELAGLLAEYKKHIASKKDCY